MLENFMSSKCNGKSAIPSLQPPTVYGISQILTYCRVPPLDKRLLSLPLSCFATSAFCLENRSLSQDTYPTHEYALEILLQIFLSSQNRVPPVVPARHILSHTWCGQDFLEIASYGCLYSRSSTSSSSSVLTAFQGVVIHPCVHVCRLFK